MVIKIEKRIIIYFVFAFLLGLLLTSQYWAEQNATEIGSVEEEQSTALAISAISDENSKMGENLEDLEQEREVYDAALANEDLEGLEARLDEYKKVSGRYTVAGEGIEIMVEGDIAPYQLLDIVNNLRNANAEAITINNNRMISSSYISGEERDIYVDGKSIETPYVIIAIGDQDLLAEAMIRTGGIINELTKNILDTRFDIHKHNELILPATKHKD